MTYQHSVDAPTAVETMLKHRGRVALPELLKKLAACGFPNPSEFVQKMMDDWRIDTDVDQGKVWVHLGRFVETAWDRMDERRACAEEGIEPDENIWRKETAEIVLEHQRRRAAINAAVASGMITCERNGDTVVWRFRP